MTERQAWFCPACQRHHAPHCDTCPEQRIAAPQGPVLPYTPYVPPVYTIPTREPSPFNPPFEITCGTLPVKSDPNMMVIN